MTLLLKFAVILIGISTLLSYQVPPYVADTNVQQWAEKLGGNPLPIDVKNNVDKISGMAQATEWLGPLAPIAISPFFGITCLAGISQFGGGYLPLNHFISTNPVLNDPTIFWIFLGLTIITSLPRLTKISKPAAQAIDQIEAYAGIITILVIRFLPGLLASSEPEPQVAMTLIQMGLFSFSVDALLGIAAIINIVVINSVKFFFEILVWMIPFPFVDALLELANKSACVGLMAIYAYSPTLATLLNLLLFAVCLIMFRWINRRVTFMRAMIGDPIWSMICPSFGSCKKSQLTVFPQENQLGFPAKTKLLLRPTETGWQLKEPHFFLKPRVRSFDRNQFSLTMREGMFINSIEFAGEISGILLFSKRYRNQSDAICDLMKMGQSDERFKADLKSALARP